VAPPLLLVNSTSTTAIYTLSLHDALPICLLGVTHDLVGHGPKLDLEPLLLEATTVRGIQPSEALHGLLGVTRTDPCLEVVVDARSEEHTSELQSRENLVCRLLLEKKNNNK